MTFDLTAFLAEHRAAYRADVDRTKILSEGWGLSHHNRIVFLCPKCGAKTGADIDLSEGPWDEMWHECEECRTTIKLECAWVTVPELVDVKISTGKE